MNHANPLGARTRRRLAALLLAAAVATPAATLAAEQTAARKVGRGVAGMVTGFLEIPGNMVKVTEEKGTAYGFSLGFAQGLGLTVIRELVGVYEFISCPFEIPAGFEPILEPEFPWGYFDQP